MFLTSLYRGMCLALVACTLTIAAPAAFAQTAPATAPAAPTNVTATASSSKITVTWNKVPGAKSYILYRSSTSGGAYTLLGTPSAPKGVDSHPYGGTTYYYVVSAVNPSGESPKSAPVSAATPAPTAVPAAPANVTAALGVPGKVHLTWPAVSGADSYIIYRSTASGSGWKLIGTPIDSRGTDSKANAGMTYYYTVTAVNTKGESPKSNEASAKTPAVK